MEQADLKAWTTEELEKELQSLQSSDCFGTFDLVLEDWIAAELGRRERETEDE
jgi:hypothetical protein